MRKPVGHALACPILIGVHRHSSAANKCSYRFPSVLSTLLPTFSRCLCATVKSNWPQMNTDKHRSITRGLIRVHPCPSVADKSFPAFSSVPSATSVPSMPLTLTFSPCLRASVVKDNHWPQMNTDKHRWSTIGFIRVHPSPSVANKCFPAFSSVPSAASVLSMLLPLTFSPRLRASVVKDKRQPLNPQRFLFFPLPSASQRLCGEY